MNPLAELIRNGVKGDSDALEELYLRYQQVLVDECRRHGWRAGDNQSNADLVQEVSMRVLTQLHQFRSLDGDQIEFAFRAWLRKTAISVMENLRQWNHAKKRSPPKRMRPGQQESDLVDVDGRTPSSIIVENEISQMVAETMATQLDDEQRSIVQMRFVDGLSFREISKRTALSYDQVRYKYQCSIQVLEQQLFNF